MNIVFSLFFTTLVSLTQASTQCYDIENAISQ